MGKTIAGRLTAIARESATPKSGQLFAVMRCCEIDAWAFRDNATGVDSVVARVVMALDVLHVHRVSNAGMLVKIPDVAGQVCVVVNATNIAFEVTNIHRIKTHQCGE